MLTISKGIRLFVSNKSTTEEFIQMSITYYPDSVHKRPSSPIDLIKIANTVYSWSGGADLDSGALSSSLWPGFPTWTVKQIGLNFSTTDAKDYAISKLVGRGIIAGLNDRLWFKADGAPAQEITLSPGFYDNDANKLTDELKTQLDASEAFIALGLAPFTVAFTPATGLFSITPDAGTIQFLFRNETKPDVHKTSNGGPVIGLTESTVLVASITSDTPSAEFGVTFEIVSGAASASTDINITDDFCMSNDDALVVTASGDMIASYVASYKGI